MADDTPTPRKKASYLPAPACFALEQACKQIREAFGDRDSRGGLYLCGSCLEGPGWHDVDIRMWMPDDDFARLFPNALAARGRWECDPRWCIMMVSLSHWLTTQTGLPVDFQILPLSYAQERHDTKPRYAIGVRYGPEKVTAANI